MDNREARQDVFTFVELTDAAQVVKTAKADIAGNQRPHSASLQKLVTIHVSPPWLPAPLALLPSTRINIIGDTDEAELRRIDAKPLFEQLCSVPSQADFDLGARQSSTARKPEGAQQLRGFRRHCVFSEILDERGFAIGEQREVTDAAAVHERMKRKHHGCFEQRLDDFLGKLRLL